MKLKTYDYTKKQSVILILPRLKKRLNGLAKLPEKQQEIQERRWFYIKMVK
jgi:hypothetical protein